MKGSELRNLRLRLGLTQKELANEINVNPNTVARWERDECSISNRLAEKILTVAMSNPSDIHVTESPNDVIDDYHRTILQSLEGRLDPVLFEQCAVDLIGQDRPGIVLVGGANDGGFDGAVSEEHLNQPYPIIVTTARDNLRNLRKNLKTICEHKPPNHHAIFATSRKINGSKRNKLNFEASEWNVTLTQIYDQNWFASSLYRNPEWCKKLLGITGQPSVLSKYPISCRPMLSSRVFGREKEIQWLLSSNCDCLVEGVPGSGKTFLLQAVVDQSKALFLNDWNPKQVANDIRKYQPSTIIVDDAHTKIEILAKLDQLRLETNPDSFRIIATSWPSGSRDVAGTLHLPNTDKITLGQIDADTMVEIIKSVGLKGPDELLRNIRQQAAGRPGLAVTLADICLRGGKGDVWSVANGERLLDQILPNIARSIDVNDAEGLLALFAFGGKSGMLPEQVAEHYGLSVMDINMKLAKLATAGIICEGNNREISVVPDQVRSALVHRVFFDQSPRLEYVSLLKRVVNPHDSLKTLVGARARGAWIPDLENHLEHAGSPHLWSEYASLGSNETRYVLDKHPDLVLEFSCIALDHAPDKAIPLLLDRVGLEKAWFLQPVDVPTRELTGWANGASPNQVDIVARRRLLLQAAVDWHNQNNNIDVALRAMLIALTPDFEYKSVDPGSGTVMTIRFGVLGSHELRELTKLWPEIASILHNSPDFRWEQLFEFISSWIDPNPRVSLSEETEKIMRGFAESLLSDLIGIARNYYLVQRKLLQLANRVGLDLEVNIVRNYDLEKLFPLQVDYEWDYEKHITELKNLAKIWKKRSPENIAKLVELVKKETARIGNNQVGISFLLFDYLADCVANPLEMAEVFVNHEFSSDSILPFALKASYKSQKGWEKFAKRCFNTDQYGPIGTEMIFCNSNPSRKLVGFAVKRANGAESRIRLRCQWGDISQDVLSELLRAENSKVALGAAIGHWYAVEQGESSDCRNELWQQTILRSASDWEGSDSDCYSLQIILTKDTELAVNWLCVLVSSNESVSFNIKNIAIEVLTDLSTHERHVVLDCIEHQFRNSTIVQHIVKDDLMLYRILLESKNLSQYHLVPLNDIHDELWRQKALLALNANYSIVDIVRAPNQSGKVRWGPSSDWSRSTRKAFEALIDDSDSRIRQIGIHGVEIYRTQTERELEFERYQAVHGIWAT